MTQAEERDHGGGLDAAIGRFGGTRTGWLVLKLIVVFVYNQF